MSARVNRFCAFCGKERQIYSQKHVGFVEFAVTGFISLIIALLVWDGFELRGLLLWAPMLVVAELFVHLRWRLGVVCGQCGFDPVLYLRDQAAASRQVKEHLARRKGDVDYLLAQPPNLPKIVRKPVKELLPMVSRAESTSLPTKAEKAIAESVEQI